MGVFDNDLILPGVITEVTSDYSTGYDTSLFGTTSSMVIIGTAFNGPTGKPVPIYSPEHARYLFGSIYDPISRKEASLVASIQDAWDRGCRTIYAVRVSGKEIYKDYQLAKETNLKLRMSGIFPSNMNKDLSMLYDSIEGYETLTIYKPANRATINEKIQGKVERLNSMLVSVLYLNGNYDINKNSRLTQLIKIVNEHAENNVLRLSIVDENGTDVTISSKEAQSLCVGDMLPGIYTVGRDKNVATLKPETDLVFKLVAKETDKPYTSFPDAEKVFKKLNLNTDVTMDIPVYVKDIATYNKKFAGAGVQLTAVHEMLSTYGILDSLFIKDKVDYEEVDITDFDLYKRLGSGYTVTAKLVPKVPGNPAKGYKVIETPVTDANKIMPIKDGIYSMLENLKVNYRVLADGEVDSVISGKLPKAADFKIVLPERYMILNDCLIATPKIEKKDLVEPKKYSFKLIGYTEDQMNRLIPTNYDSIYMDQTIRRITKVTQAEFDKLKNPGDYVAKKVFPNGTLFLVDDGTGVCTQYRYADGEYVELSNMNLFSNLLGKYFVAKDKDANCLFIGRKADTSDKLVFTRVMDDNINSKKFILVESMSIVNIYKIETDGKVIAIGELSQIFDPEIEDKTLISIQSEHETENDIIIRSSAFDYETLEGFVNILNANKNLLRLFSFSIANEHRADKDMQIEEKFVAEFDPNKDYKKDDEVSVYGVTYKANADIAKGPFAVAAKDPVSGLINGWVPVDTSIKIWTASTPSIPVSFKVGDVVVVPGQTPEDSKPFICTKDHTVKDTDTWATDKVNFEQYVYKADRYPTSDLTLYIPYRTTDNFARHMAQHCTYTGLKTIATHGILGCKKILDVNLNSVAEKVNSLLSLDTSFYAKKDNGIDMRDKNSLPYPIGKNISVVFGQYIVRDDENDYSYISNGAAGYAGMVTALPLDQSSTSQPIFIPTQMFDLTNYQLERLTQKGFVTFTQSFTKGFVVTDGITMAEPASEFKRLSVSRIINHIEQEIRAAADPYTGKQNHLTNRNSLQTAIKSALEKMKGTLIEAYDFKLRVDNNSLKLGIINIDYKIVPVYEIRQIKNTIDVREKI